MLKGLEDVARAAGGRRLTPWPEDRPIRFVTTDSREVGPGDVFVAISGGRTDGASFLADAAARGAILGIIPADRPRGGDFPAGMMVIEVPDTRAALGRIASAWRRRLSALRVIAITGSCGKTTTKRLVHAVLGTRLPGRAAPASFNNDLGVPITLLSARPADRYLVVEVGTNAPGEIAALAALADPDVAVITSIGRAHLGGFRDAGAILHEKASLLTCLREGGAAIVRDLDCGLGPYLREIGVVVRFGESERADVRLTARDVHGGTIEVNGRRRFPMRLHGRHNAINALAAIAVGRRMGLEEADIALGLGSVVPDSMRLCRERVGQVDAWNDAYNANPDSMSAALEAFVEESVAGEPRWVIFGTMLELGDRAGELHEALAQEVAECVAGGKLCGAIFVGEYAPRQCAILRSQCGRETAEAFAEIGSGSAVRDHLKQRLGAGGAVLVKGSRALGLESVLERLREELSAEAAATAK